MIVQLVQRTIEYANIRENGDAPTRSMNEGTTLAAVLPYIYACSHDDAEIIYSHENISGQQFRQLCYCQKPRE